MVLSMQDGGGSESPAMSFGVRIKLWALCMGNILAMIGWQKVHSTLHSVPVHTVLFQMLALLPSLLHSIQLHCTMRFVTSIALQWFMVMDLY